MFYFDAVNDIDLDSYAYQLYDIPNPTSSTTPIASGKNKANVFTISVTNSTDSTPKTYYGRVAVVNSAGTVGTYTSLVSSGATPLIGNQYITSLTAAKITSGTVSAAEITLSGTNSVIKSSTYDGSFNGAQWTTGSAGWLISGSGQAIFDSSQIRGSISAASINLDTDNYWVPSTVGPPSTPIKFKVGNASNFFEWDGTNVRTTGTLITNATVSGGTVGGINAGSGATANRFYIGTGTFNNANTAFYVDSAGQFSLKDKFVWTGSALTIAGDVTIGSQTATAVSAAVTTANNAATAAATAQSTANGAQSTANGKVNPADVLNHIGGASITTISGGKVTTGTISSVDGTCLINLDNGSINFRNKFIVDSAGNASFNGNITAASGTFSGTLSGASGSITDNLTIGNNVRINGATGDNSQSVVKIKADAQNAGNPNNYGRWPLNVVSSANNTCLRVASDARIDIGESGGVTSEVYIDGTLWKSSDIRLKENIQLTNLGLNFINKLSPVSYNLINEKITKNHYGFIAQDVKKVLEDLNADFAGWHLNDNDDKESTQVLSYEEFISPLVKAVQELSAKVDELESRLV
jgi:hypothetical protein